MVFENHLGEFKTLTSNSGKYDLKISFPLKNACSWVLKIQYRASKHLNITGSSPSSGLLMWGVRVYAYFIRTY